MDIFIRTQSITTLFHSFFRSPGFGLSLVAETTNGAFLSAELVSNPQGEGVAVLPEDLGTNCAKLLLEEIYRVSDWFLLSLEYSMEVPPQVFLHFLYLCGEWSGCFYLNAAL